MIHGPPIPSFAPAKQSKTTPNEPHTLATKSSISDVAGLLERIRKPWKNNHAAAKLPSNTANNVDDTSDSNSNRISKEVPARPSDQAYIPDSLDAQLAGFVVSNPCFHPLRQKLSPRIEPVMKRHPTKGSLSPVSGSSIKAPFNRGHAGNSLSGSTYGGTRESANSIPNRTQRASEIMNGFEDGSQDEISLGELLAREEFENRHLPRHHVGNRSINRPASQRRHRRSKSTNNPIARGQSKLTAVPGRRQSLQPLSVAVILSQGDHTRKFVWDKYLDQYSKGSYNMCNPPSPEVVDNDFVYLPAVFPQDEINRISIARQIDSLWLKYGAMEGPGLVKQAAKFFDVEFAAISFFDERREIFKAQYGMDSDGVFGRPYSITAHALYTMDVFVVTDAKQDWRFRKNPWVEQWPGARFIAVAPMVVDNQIIGTFAVLDKYPKPIFSYENRRDLIDFADIAIENTKKEYESRQRAAFYRQTPILERDSVIFGTQNPLATLSTTPSNIPLTISKTMTIQQTVTDNRLSSEELTPPSSADESRPFNDPARAPHVAAQYSFPLPPRTLSGSLGHAPRPYSVSDLSSVHENPAPTPQIQDKPSFNSRPLGELTSEHFFGLTDRDLYEPSILEFAEPRVSVVDKSMAKTKPRSQIQVRSVDEDVQYDDWSSYVHNEMSQEKASRNAENSDDEGEEFTGPVTIDMSQEYTQIMKSDPSPERKGSQRTIDSKYDERRGVYPGPPPSVAPPPIPLPVRPTGSNNSTPKRSPLLPQPASVQIHPKRSSSVMQPSKGSPRAICAQNGVRYSATDHHANLTSVCANIASTLNYALVYLVEINSSLSSPNLSKVSLASEQIYTKILSHYPLINPDSIVVGAAQHIETLQKTISIFKGDGSKQERKSIQPGLKDYTFGILLSVNPAALSNPMSHGVILGAFKSDDSPLLLKDTSFEQKQPGFEEAEVTKLQSLVKVLALEELLFQEEVRKQALLCEEKVQIHRAALENVSEEESSVTGLGLELQLDLGNNSTLSPIAENEGQQGTVGRGRSAKKDATYSDDDEIF